MKETITAEFNAVRGRLLDGWDVTVKGDPVIVCGGDDYLVYRGIVCHLATWKLIEDEEAVCTKEWKVRGQVVGSFWGPGSRLSVTLSDVTPFYPQLHGKTVEITVVDKQ